MRNGFCEVAKNFVENLTEYELRCYEHDALNRDMVNIVFTFS